MLYAENSLRKDDIKSSLQTLTEQRLWLLEEPKNIIDLKYLNDKDTVKALKQLGVNGVIYDRMDWNNDKLVKESIFMTKERSVTVDFECWTCNKQCINNKYGYGWTYDKQNKTIFRTGDSLSSGVSSAGSDYSPVSSPGRWFRKKKEVGTEGKIWSFQISGLHGKKKKV